MEQNLARLEQIKSLLEAERKRAEELIEAKKSELKDESALTSDVNDEATEGEHQANILGLIAKEEELIYQINLTIERIRLGDYGNCKECGCDIPVKRLVAKPETDLCIDCMRELETQSKLA